MPYELMNEEPSSGELSFEDVKDVPRNIARGASNLATLGVGLSGDVFSMINDYIANPAVEALGGKSVPYEKTLLGKVLPTTGQHRKNIEEYTGEYLKPHNEVEKFVDDVEEDAFMLFNPVSAIKAGVKKGPKLIKSIFKSLGANIAGETVKQVTSSEGAGLATKAGGLFLLSLLDKESAAKQVGKLYQEAEKHLPPGVTTNASKLGKQIDALEYTITKGRPVGNLSPPEMFVVKQINNIKNLIKNGQISVEQAMAQKRSLGKELATLYKEVPKHKDQKSVKNLAKQITGFLNETITDYGKTNKKFIVPYKDADLAFGTLARSNFVSHWVDKNVVQSPVTKGLLHLFNVAAPAATTGAAAVAPAAIAAVPVYQGAKLLYRITKSPALAKIYAKTTAAAVKEDAVLFNKYLKELDDAMQQEENEDKYEFVD